jgi:DNA polymerase (family 10)
VNAIQVADLLEEIGDLLEILGENPFKTRAYRNGAHTLRALDRDLTGLVQSGELGRLKGIGRALSEKITTLVETGQLPYLDELRASVPPATLDLLKIPGLGPKKAHLLVDRLQVGSIGELEYACHENRLLHLEGFGAKSQERILEGIAQLNKYANRFLMGDAVPLAEAVIRSVIADPAVARAAIAGDLRRRTETVGGLNLVAAGSDPGSVRAALARSPRLTSSSPEGDAGLHGVLDTGMPLRVSIVPEASYVAELLHATGPASHLAALHARGRERGLDLNERGLFRDGEQVACRDEAAIYRALDLPFFPPELREAAGTDPGRTAGALAGSLPRLVENEDILGVLHVHSTWSDGRLGIEAILERCSRLGYQYVGISDHSQSARYARGLSPDSLRRQQEEIDTASPGHPGLRVFKGSEVDILPDGALDYSDEILKTLDFVVASVHSSFRLPRAEQTRRIVRAVKHPRTTILGHPTGRLLLAREAYDVDLEEVMRAAAGEGVYLELNANPRRLDLDSDACRRARALGARFAVNPDAHDADGLSHVRYGIAVARRAGLEATDILNTLPPARLAEALARRL